MALGVAVVPTLGAFALASLTGVDALLVAVVVAFPAFAYLAYRRRTMARMASSALLWLALESFVAPVAAILYVTGSVGGGSGSAIDTAIAGVQGGVVLLLAFLVCIPLGIGFYVLSGRFDPEQ